MNYHEPYFQPHLHARCLDPAILGGLVWSGLLVLQGYYHQKHSNIKRHTCHHLPHVTLALARILPVRPKSHQGISKASKIQLLDCTPCPQSQETQFLEKRNNSQYHCGVWRFAASAWNCGADHVACSSFGHPAKVVPQSNLLLCNTGTESTWF
jgi:hypothetical protein